MSEDDQADRVAAHLSTFGVHLVDGLEAVRNLLLSAIDDLSVSVRRELDASARSLERIQAQLASAGELSVAEAEHLAALAAAVREIGRNEPARSVPSDGGVPAASLALEVASVRIACDSLRGSVDELHEQLVSLRVEIEELHKEVGQSAPPISSDSDQELSRLATEVRLLRRRIQLQAAAKPAPPADAAAQDATKSNRRTRQ